MSQFDFTYIRSHLLPDIINDRNPIGNLTNNHESIQRLLDRIGAKVKKAWGTYGGTPLPDIFTGINMVRHHQFDLQNVMNYVMDPKNCKFSGSPYILDGPCHYCDLTFGKIYHHTRCNHGACKGCWEKLIVNSIGRQQSKPLIPCIGSGSGCNVCMGESMVRELGEDLVVRTNADFINQFINSPGVVRCCSRIFYNPLPITGRGKLINVTCDSCYRRVCLGCRKLFCHIPLPCDLHEHFDQKVRRTFPFRELASRKMEFYDVCPRCPQYGQGRSEVRRLDSHVDDLMCCPKCNQYWCYVCYTQLLWKGNGKHTTCPKKRKKPVKEVERWIEKLDKLSRVRREGQQTFVDAFVRYSYYIALADRSHREYYKVSTSNFRKEKIRMQFIAQCFLAHVHVLKYYLFERRNIPDLPPTIRKFFKSFAVGGKTERFFLFQLQELENGLTSDSLPAKIQTLYTCIHDLLDITSFLPSYKEFLRKETLPKPHEPMNFEEESPYQIINHFIKEKRGIKQYEDALRVASRNRSQGSNRRGNNQQYEDDLQRALRASMMSNQQNNFQSDVARIQKMQQEEEERMLQQVMMRSLIDSQPKSQPTKLIKQPEQLFSSSQRSVDPFIIDGTNDEEDIYVIDSVDEESGEQEFEAESTDQDEEDEGELDDEDDELIIDSDDENVDIDIDNESIGTKTSPESPKRVEISSIINEVDELLANDSPPASIDPNIRRKKKSESEEEDDDEILRDVMIGNKKKEEESDEEISEEEIKSPDYDEDDGLDDDDLYGGGRRKKKEESDDEEEMYT